MATGLAPATSSQAQEMKLSEPDAAFPEDFGAIMTVRELPDGRVLVADPLGKQLFAVDLDAGTRIQIGGEGEGPQEYKQPDAVWPLPGDSTLLVDLGNGRLVALGPDLSFGPTMPIALSDVRAGEPLVLALPQGVDGRGRIYVRMMGGTGPNLPDSADIMRIDRATRKTRIVARFKLGDRTRTTSGGANSQNVSIRNVPLSPEDAWGVAPDGSVAVVRSADYHLEWVRPDGTVVRGRPVSFTPVPIRTAEKEEWLAESGRSGGGIGISVEIENGVATTSFQRGIGRAREIDRYTWPDVEPGFYRGRVKIDPLGRAWVRRHRRAGEPPLYDVFGADGNRVAGVSFPRHRQLVGFGRHAAYVVSFDDFDLAYLERYALPPL